jgi:hypothetical protein
LIEKKLAQMHRRSIFLRSVGDFLFSNYFMEARYETSNQENSDFAFAFGHNVCRDGIGPAKEGAGDG